MRMQNENKIGTDAAADGAAASAAASRGTTVKTNGRFFELRGCSSQV